MSDGDIEVVGESSDGGSKKPKPSQKAAVVAIAAVVGVVFYFNVMRKPPAPQHGGQQTTQQASQNKAGALGANSSGMSAGLSISGPNQSKSVAVLSEDLQKTQKALAQTQAMLNKLATENQAFQSQIKDQFDKQNSTIRSLMVNQSQRAVEANYRNGQPGNNGGQLPSLGGSGSTAGATPTAKKFAYVSLSSPQSSGASAAANQGAQTTQDLKNFTLGSNGTSTPAPHGNIAARTAINVKNGVVAGAQPIKDVFIKGRKYKENTIQVAAGSFAKAVLLHGVDCPIGSSLPGATGGAHSSLFKSTPVALAIDGPFKGPDGEIIRGIGKAMVLGVCQGMRTTSRGVIKIEALSVDFHGKQQKIDINGYLIDGRDNDINVHGKIVSNRLGSVLESGLASGLAAYSQTISQGQYTNTMNTNGTSSSVLTGSAAQAAGMQLFAGPMSALASMAAADAAASVDVVHLKPMVPVYLEVVDPFTVNSYKPVEASNDQVLR